MMSRPEVETEAAAPVNANHCGAFVEAAPNSGTGVIDAGGDVDGDADVNEVDSVFQDLRTGDAMDGDDFGLTQIESLCMNCHENGMSRLLLMNIPFFRQVMVMSFTCEHCHFRSNEIENAGEIGERGITYNLNVATNKDLNRQLIKTKYCTVKIPELDFEIPPQRGELTTVEGILQQTIDGLEMQQPLRRIQHPEVAAGIDAFVEKLRGLQDATTPFHLELSDPSGNSFIENPNAPKPDPDMAVSHFFRNQEQNAALGIGVQDMEQIDAQTASEVDAQTATEVDAQTASEVDASTHNGDATRDDTEKEEAEVEELWNTDDRVGYNEALVFDEIKCPQCGTTTETRMKVVDIPHFKEVIVMATTCDNCGYSTNDVRVGGAIEPKGVRISLKVTCKDDLSRDILKTETASLEIPELELKTEEGTLGGGFTTIDGILTQMADQLEKSNPFLVGDSAQAKDGKLMQVVDKLRGFIDFSEPFHIILDDPVGSSHIQNLYAPDPDPEMTVAYYERTEEQNIEFGLHDMKTENYEDDA